MSALSSSIPSIKIKTTPSDFSPRLPSFTTIKCSKADGPLRRPSAPSLSPPPSSPPPPPPVPPPPPTTAVFQTQSPLVKKPMEAALAAEVMLEYQRKMAKELQGYFKQKKLEEAVDRGPFFRFIDKNEIANGRWAMFVC